MVRALENVSGRMSQERRGRDVPLPPLGRLLVARSDVQPSDIEKAQQIQKSMGGLLGPLLVRTGAISEDVLLLRLAELLDAVYLRNPDDLPDSLEVYRFLSEAPIKLEWFLDNAVLMWTRGRRAPLSRPGHPGPRAPRSARLLLSRDGPSLSAWPPTTRSIACWTS